MTGQLEQLEKPESRNDRKAGTTGNPELSEKPKQTHRSLRQYNVLGEQLFISLIGNADLIIEILCIFCGFPSHDLLRKNF
jgi:hypothetical protein